MKTPRSPLVLAMALALAALVIAAPARADVGVEQTSRRAGSPGTAVTLTLGCGFCFPPCVGPKGERHPKGFDHGPCMLDTKKEPPAFFGIFLAPLGRAGHKALTYLGRAVPPPGGNDPEGGDPPRYLLDFAIPDLPPGPYAYEIRCDACAPGKRASLIAAPASPLWRLSVRVRPAVG